MDTNKVMAQIMSDAQNKIRAQYEKELENHLCSEHGKASTLKPNENGFDIISCCQSQHDFVVGFLESKK